jgi:di/tricarboxylate transporter
MPGNVPTNLLGWKRSGPFDERFIMHRFKSTRLAVLVGTVTLLALFMYHAVVYKAIRWDLFGVLAAMAVAKSAAMLYYRKTN